MSAHKEWQAHGLKIWETGSDGLERVIADFNQNKYEACRLAAAAPALLEALEACVSHIRRLHGDNDIPDIAKAAIAKARS